MSLLNTFKSGMAQGAPVIATTVVAVPLAALLAYHVSTATTVLVGAVAAPGALEVAYLVLESGEVIVYSLVEASILSKVIIATTGILVIGVIAYTVYHLTKEYRDSK